MDEKNGSTIELSSLNEHEVRLEKIKAMQSKNINPWPEYKEVSATCAQARAEFETNKDESKRLSIAGRLNAIREHGKTVFANIHDRTGTLQIYIRKDALGDEAFEFFKHFIDTGDIIWCEGTLFITKMGELTLKVDKTELLSKCLHPLPEKYHGLTDIEQRYRQRYLDLISNPESKEKFISRSKTIHAIREFLTKHDFIEVETPMLHPIPGGAAARPFVTHHNAYDMDLFLRIAPELYLKRLVIGGFERVFEINRNFRNEGISTKHNPEFTMLEFYMAHGDYERGMELTEELIRYAITESGPLQREFKEQTIDFSKPFKKLTVLESLKVIGGLSDKELDSQTINETIRKAHLTLSPQAHYGEKLWALFEALVEDKLFEPTFIIGHPVEVSPLAKRNPNDPHTVSRFELFVGGFELANGFTELNDPFDQAERFKMQVEQSKAGNDEAHHYDADYVRALEYGLPPTVGVGIGIDRLVMLLTNTSSIKDVILFPTLKLSKNETKEGQKQLKPSNSFAIDSLVFKNFPLLKVGTIIAKDLTNTSSNKEIAALLKSQCEKIKNEYTLEDLLENKKIQVWRDAYRSFKSKPSEYRASIENLIRMILKGKDLYSDTPLVNLYNYISLKYLLPAGGENLDNITPPIELTYATANEAPVLLLGDSKEEKPYEGEIIYKDIVGTLCRRWNWREVDRIKLTTSTHNAFFVLESLLPETNAILPEALDELSSLLKVHFNGNITTNILDQSQHFITL